MFTGIITDLGIVTKNTNSSLSISTNLDLIKKLKKGSSIAVNGICLTVVSKYKNNFSIDFIKETKEKTNIQSLISGSKVNLELPATMDSMLSGHIVLGHVDEVAKIISIKEEGNSHIFTITIPNSLNKFLVEKCSISVNGISLTIISVKKKYFTVGIIPHTWKNTMLYTAKAGDDVNIEIDILAKHIEKILNYEKN